MKCPKCGSPNIFTTCMGIIALRYPAKNDNYSRCCACKHKGRAWEFGAPDIQPMKGSENITDKEIKEFWKNPVARGVYGPKGIQVVKFDKEKP